MKSFQNRRVFITGGSSGIGLALAETLVQQGAHVCIVSRKSAGIKAAVKRLRELAPANAANITGYTADVGSYRQLKSVYRKYRRDFGVPHVLFNCAGFSRPGYAHSLPLHQFYRQMETNFYGTVHGVRILSDDWIKRGEGGVIVNVASLAGFLGVFGFSAYSPTKFAVMGFSEVLRQELAAYKIRVHVACPPDTATPGLKTENDGKPYETVALSGTAKLMSARAVAESILAGVRRNRFVILSNFESRWIYAVSRWLPGLSRRVIDGMIRRAQKSARPSPADSVSARRPG